MCSKTNGGVNVESHAKSIAASKEMRWPSQQSLFRSSQLESKVKIGQVYLQKIAHPANGQLIASIDRNSVWKKKSGTDYTIMKHFNLFLSVVIPFHVYLQYIHPTSLSRPTPHYFVQHYLSNTYRS